MSDQAGLFDLPDPVPPRPPTRSGRGRARDTFARTVVADVSVEDAGALRAEASRALDHTVVIGETTDAENDDLPDLREEISTSPAAAVQWCVEPTIGMGPSLESGAVRIDMIDHSAEEKSAGLVRVAWTVAVKILAARGGAGDPGADGLPGHRRGYPGRHPGVTWTSVEVTVKQVLARAR